MYNPDTLTSESKRMAVSLNRVYNFVYGWMALGLALSGIVAFMVAQSITPENAGNLGTIVLGCFVAELVLVFVLAGAIHKMSPAVAALLFLGYSALNGVTLSVILLAYTPATVQTAFFVAAGMFAGMALFGTLTKMNLSTMGRICMMAVWGLIIASLVNIFMHSTGLHAIITYAGVAIFVGLTAWDAQKVRILAEQQASLDDNTLRKLGILCALELYLDFINLFIYLLRIFGDRRS